MGNAHLLSPTGIAFLGGRWGWKIPLGGRNISEREFEGFRQEVANG